MTVQETYVLNMLLRQAYEREIAVSSVITALESLEGRMVELHTSDMEVAECLEPTLLDHLVPWIALVIGLVLGYAMHMTSKNEDD